MHACVALPTAGLLPTKVSSMAIRDSYAREDDLVFTTNNCYSTFSCRFWTTFGQQKER